MILIAQIISLIARSRTFATDRRLAGQATGDKTSCIIYVTPLLPAGNVSHVSVVMRTVEKWELQGRR